MTRGVIRTKTKQGRGSISIFQVADLKCLSITHSPGLARERTNLKSQGLRSPI